ncbi:MAG: hypothetical protein IPJ98_08065 [Bryobacterales bacterium]|nr:hypothetical protein [Bryobacterales bacterium]
MVSKRNLLGWMLAAPLALALNACGERKLELPAVVGTEWKLRTREQLAALHAPQNMQALGLQGWWHAEYDGPAAPAVFLYEMKTAATAFELVQKHRSTPGVIALNIDRAFITMQTVRGTMPDLNRFASAFEKAF